MYIFCLLESSDGKIWSGTLRSGLHSYDSKKWTEYLPRGMHISCLLESQDGTLWAGIGTEGVGTYASVNGLRCYDGTTWQVHLNGMWIHSLFESSDGTIWAGVEGPWVGLQSYDGTKWTEHKNVSGYVSSTPLLESSDGKIWASASVYDGTMWTRHLNGMGVRSLLEPKDGKIWATTYENGVWVYDGITWKPHTILDESPGLVDVYAILEFSDGNMWFGTDRGIVVYKPSKNPPSIEITEPKEKVVKTGTASLFIRWKVGDNETETHRLTYHQYKLDDGQWTPTGTAFITLTGLEDGEHTFYVRTIDGDFNYSEPATLTIIVDTIRPTALIGSPSQGAIVGGTVKITGVATDEDFVEFKVEYAEGEVLSDGDFKLIRQSNHAVKFGQLADWNTQPLGETQYTIRVHASDKLGLTKDDTVTVTLDNTPPVAKLIAPQDGFRLTKQTEISGEVSDKHIDGYVLEYTTETNPDTAIWRQIFKKTELLQEKQTQVRISYEWEVPTISGTIFIRLTVIDAAGNTDAQTISVEVPETITKDKGGKTISSDGDASLDIPPRSLPKDTIVTLNRVPKFVFREGIHPLKTETDEIQPPPDKVKSLDLAYDLGPKDLKLRTIKPATLQVKLDSIPAQNKKRIAFFRWDEKWAFLGGTVQDGKATIGITQFGRYALMEVETTFEPSGLDALFTCQPRVFSPKQGKTTISFSLKKAASVTLKVYNLDGRLQKTLISSETMYAGRNAVLWDGRDEDDRVVPSGLYLIALSIDDGKVKTKTVVIQNR